VRCQLCDGRAPPSVFKAAKLAHAEATKGVQVVVKPITKHARAATSDKEPTIQDVQVQLAAIAAEQVRLAKERKEDGFTVAKSKATKRKEKRDAKAAAAKTQDQVNAVPRSTSSNVCTGAAIRISEVAPTEEDMDDDPASEASIKDKAVALAGVVKDLEGVLARHEDPHVRATLDAKKAELDQVNVEIKAQANASKQPWQTTRELEAKKARKRQALEKTKSAHALLESKLVEWRHDMVEQDKAKVTEIAETKSKWEALQKEVEELEQECQSRNKRFNLGSANAQVAELTNLVMQCPANPTHEWVLALQSTIALLSNAQHTTDERVAASQASGISVQPDIVAATAEEERVRLGLAELSRQMHGQADAFIAEQKRLEELRAKEVRHLASLQAMRAQAPLAAVPPDPAAAVGTAPLGNGDNASGPTVAPGGADDAAAQAVALGVVAGQQAATLAAAAIPVDAADGAA